MSLSYCIANQSRGSLTRGDKGIQKRPFPRYSGHTRKKNAHFIEATFLGNFKFVQCEYCCR